MKTRWVWLGGWGIAPAAIEDEAKRRWPDIEHQVIFPGRNWQRVLAGLMTERPTRLLGYSLGAFLLLRERVVWEGPTSLLAPFLDFRAETRCGGRVSIVQLRFLTRWLSRDPFAAIGDFYRRAAISIPVPTTLPYPLEDLVWGIEQLTQSHALPLDHTQVSAVMGAQDFLLDVAVLQTLIPRTVLLPDAGHDLEQILDGLSVCPV